MLKYLFSLSALFTICGCLQIAHAQTMTSATHESDDQRSVTIFFDAVPSSNPSDYRLASGSISVTSATLIGTSGRVILTLASPVPLGLSSFEIRYQPTGQRINSENNRVIVCDDFEWQSTNVPTPSCSPVDPITIMTFSVLPGARNSSQWDIDDVEYRVFWAGGTGITSQFDPYESDDSGVPSSSTYYISGDASPLPFQYPNNPSNCFSISIWRIRINGSDCPIGKVNQRVTYATHHTDEFGDGNVRIRPRIIDSDKVCINDEVDMSMRDVSSLNCINESTEPNDQTRWVRVIYGDKSRPAADRIPNIYVDGVQVTDDNGNLINISGGGAEDGYIPTYNSSSAALGTGDFYGVVTFTDPDNDLPAGNLDDITSNTTAAGWASRDVGDRFYVRIEYWNKCNPYDGVGNSANNEVLNVEYIELIESPPIPTPVSRVICEGDDINPVTFRVNDTGGSTRVLWYDDDPDSGGGRVTNPLGNNSADFPALAYPGGIDTNMPGEYSLWATYVIGATNSCESDPVEIPLTVREALDRPNIISGTNMICNNTTSVGFSLPVPAGSTTLGGAAEYEWDVIGGAGITLSATTGQNITINVNIGGSFTSATRSLRVRRVYSSLPNCASAWRVMPLTIYGETQGGSTDPANTICEAQSTGTITLSGYLGTILRWERQKDGGGYTDIGNGGNDTFDEILSASGTYDYRAVIDNGSCTVENSTVTTVVVNPIPVKPSITEVGDGLQICENGDNVILQSSNVDGNADKYAWFKDPDLTTPVQFSNSSQLFLNTLAETGRYYVQVIGVPPNECPSLISDPIDVIINPLPTAEISGGGAECSGTAGPPSIIAMTGTGPFDVTYERDGTPTTASGITSPYIIPGSEFVVDGTQDDYVITSVTDLGTTVPCTASAPSGNITGATTLLRLNVAPPVVEDFRITGEACDDGAGTLLPPIILDLNNSVPIDYDITFEIHNSLGTLVFRSTATIITDASGVMVIGPSVLNYADLSNTPDSYLMTFTEIVDLAGCSSSGLPASQSLVINPRPAEPANPANTISCSSGPINPVTVDDPGAGYTIRWFTAYTDPYTNTPATAADGTVSGSNGELFTPATSATNTFYAAVETDASGCLSNLAVTLVHTQDTDPSPADADADDDPEFLETCDGTLALEAVAADNGGAGTWSAPGILYFEDFNGKANGTTVDTDLYGWSVDVSAGDLQPGNYFQVRNRRFEALGSGDGTVTWRSSPIDISGVASFHVGMQVTQQGGVLEADDAIELFYAIDGGGLVSVGNVSDDFGAAILSDSTISTGGGASLVLFVRVDRLNEDDEHISFDNIIVRDAASADVISFSDINDVNATVSGLPIGTTTLTWTVSSALGACNYSTDVINVITYPLPAANDITPELCEDLPSGGSLDVAGVDLTDPAFSDAITGIAGSANRTIEYYVNPARTGTHLIATPTAYDLSDGEVIYVRVIDTGSSTFPANYCVQDATITFTVNPLPAIDNQNNINNPSETVFCEEAVGSGFKNDIDLTTLDDNVVNGVTADRSVDWYFDPGTPVTDRSDLAGSEIVTPADVDNVMNGDIFYAVIQNTITGCEDVAQVDMTINSRPIDNPIIAPDGSSPSSVTLCKTSNRLFFQINPLVNPGSTYAWTVPTELDLEVGAGPNDSYLLFSTPNVIPAGVTLSVTEISPAGCQGNSNDITIFVDDNPPPPSIIGEASVCQNQSGVVYSINSPNPGSSYTWNIRGLGSIISGQGSSSIIVNAGIFGDVITVVETSAVGCNSGSSAPFPVTVNPPPVMTSPATLTLCSGDSVNSALNLTADTGGALFSWTVQSKSSFVGGTLLGNFGSGDITETLINGTNNIGTVVYSVQPYIEYAAGVPCNGPIQLVTVSVEPTPSAVLSTTTPVVCNGDNVNVNITSLTTPTDPADRTFDYTVTSTDDASMSGSAFFGVPNQSFPLNITGNLINSSADPITVTYTVTPKLAGCADGADVILDIVVDPTPELTANLLSSPVVCNGENISIQVLKNTNANTSTDLTYSISVSSSTGNLGDISGEEPFNGLSGQVYPGTVNASITNVTNSDIDLTFEFTPHLAGCPAGTPQRVTVTLKPTSTASDMTATICSDEPVGVRLPAIDLYGVAITSYDISAVVAPGLTGTPTRATGTTNTDAIAADVFNNAGAVPLDVEYTITPYTAGCPAASFSITVTINPEPEFTGNLNTSGCSDESIGVMLPLVDDDGDAITSYDVSATVAGGLSGTATVVVGTTDANAIASDVFTNLTNSFANVIYTVTPYRNACAGNPFTITVRIDPEPVFTRILHVTVCSDESTGVVLPSVDDDGDAITSYDITAVADPNLTGTATTRTGTSNINAILNDQFTNVTTGPWDVVYTVTPYRNTCAGDDFTITVTIEKEPLFTRILDATVCSGEKTNVLLPAIDDDGDSITGYDITGIVGSGLSRTTTSVINTTDINEIASDTIYNFSNTPSDVVYTITPYINGCIGDEFDIIVTIDPEPEFTGNLNTTICSGENTGVTLPITDDDGDVITSYDITAVVGAGLTGAGTIINGTTNANAIAGNTFENLTGSFSNVIYTVTPYRGACAGEPFSITVSVNPEPVYTRILDTDVCSDEMIGIALPSVDDNTDIITSFDIAAVATAGLAGVPANVTGTTNLNAILNDKFTNTTNGPLDVVYTVTPYRNACAGTAFDITVTVGIEPLFTGDLDRIICSSQTTEIVLPSVDDDGDVITSYDVNVSYDAGISGAFIPVTDTPDITIIKDEILINSGTAPADATYTITPYINGCVGSAFTIAVRVDPSPIYSGNLNRTRCSREVTGITLPNSDDNGLPITKFDISATVGAGLVGTASTGNNLTDVNHIGGDAFENRSSTPIDVVYTITPYYGICPGLDITITVTVNPEPVFTDNLNTTVCSDQLIDVVLPLQDDSMDTITSYTVSAVVGSGLSGIASAGSGITNIDFIRNNSFTNISYTPEVVTYTVVPYIGSCPGDSFDIEVTIDPEPLFTGNLNEFICSGEKIGILLPNTDDDGNNITSYDISAAVGTGLTGTAFSGTGITNLSAIANDIFENLTGTTVDVVYTITPYMGSCVGSNFTIAAKIMPEPLYTGDLDNTVCSGDITGVVLARDDDFGNRITSFDISSNTAPGLSGSPTSGTTLANTNVIFNDKFTNTTSSPLNAEYTVTPYINSCKGDPYVVTVTIDPEPLFTGSLDVAVCSGDTIRVMLPPTDDSADSISTYDVSAVVPPALSGSATEAVATTDVNLIFNDTFTNLTNGSYEVVYTVTPYMGSCIGVPFTITALINPEPVFTQSLDNTICSGEVTSVLLPTSDDDGRVINSFDIVAAVGTGLTGAASFGTAITNKSLILNDDFYNLTNAPIDVVYTITPYFGSCPGADFTVTVTVNPEPVIDADILTSSVCSDEPSGIVLTWEDTPPSEPAVAFDVNQVILQTGLVAGGANAGLGNNQAPGTLINDVFTNVTPAPLNVIYRVVPVSAAGCRGKEENITLTIQPAPAMDDLNTIVCSEDTTGIGVVLATRFDSAPAANYNVISITPHPDLAGSPGNAVPNVTGDPEYITADVWINTTDNPLEVYYRVQPATGAGCLGPADDIIVTIEPEPGVDDPGDFIICSGEKTAIPLNSSVKPTSGDITFDIYGTPDSALVTGYIALMQNAANGFIIENAITNNSNEVQTVTYEIIPRAIAARNGGGCSAGASTFIQVTIEPKPTLTVPAIVTICEDQSLAISLTSPTNPSSGSVVFEITDVTATGGVTGFSPPGTVFNNGDNLTDNLDNPTTESQKITYEFTPRATGTTAGTCTGEPTYMVVEVAPRPRVTPAETDVRICSGDFINIELPTDVDNSIVSWTVSANADVVGQRDGKGTSLYQSLVNNSPTSQVLTYTVQPFSLLDNTCTGPPEVITVTVDPIPNIEIADDQLVVCAGEEVIIPLEGDTPNTTFEVVATSSDTYLSGYFDLTGTNGDVVTQAIANSGTSSGTILYTVTPVFNQPAPGAGACKGTPAVVVVTVSPVVSLAIVPHPEEGMDTRYRCNGDAEAVQVEFTGSAPFELTWKETDAEGNTTTKTQGALPATYVFLATETITYELVDVKDVNGCTATSTDRTEVVFEEANAAFQVRGTDALNASSFTSGNLSVNLDFTTGKAEVEFRIDNFNPANAYLLKVGNDVFNVTSATFPYTFNQPSTPGSLGILVELQVNSPNATRCNDVATLFVAVLPPAPTVRAAASKLEGCPPFDVDFTSFAEDLSLSRNVLLTTLTWIIDGQKVVSPNLMYTFTQPGIYDVEVRGDNGYGQADFDNLVISVFEKPTSEFIITQSTVYIPDDGFRPSNRSIGAEEYYWDFGDLNTSTQRTPEHFYEYEGQYEVTLDVVNERGCTDTKRDTIIVEEGGFTKTPNAFTPSLNGPSGGGEIDPRDLKSGDQANDIFMPITTGVTDFKMWIYDRWGNLIFFSDNQRVGWDGYNSSGELLPAGVYVYKLDLILSSGQRTTRVGDITLIR